MDVDKDEKKKKVLKNCVLDVLAQLMPNFPSFYSSDVNFPYGDVRYINKLGLRYC